MLPGAVWSTCDVGGAGEEVPAVTLVAGHVQVETAVVHHCAMLGCTWHATVWIASGKKVIGT